MARMDVLRRETTRLLECWYEGDETALSALLERHLPTIRTMVRKRLGDYLRQRDQTGDFVQEAVLKFLKAGPSVRIENEKSLCAFLARVVENMMNDRYDFYRTERRGGLRRAPVTLDTQAAGYNEDTPSRLVSEEEERQRVRVGLEFLEAGDRAVIFLRRWEGKSAEAAAEELGISAEAAQKRFSRAMQRLAGIVRRLGNGQLDPLLAEAGVIEA